MKGWSTHMYFHDTWRESEEICVILRAFKANGVALAFVNYAEVGRCTTLEAAKKCCIREARRILEGTDI